jgi:hypothetical protein
MHWSMVGWFVASADSSPQYRQTTRLFGDGDFVTVPSMKLWTALGQGNGPPSEIPPRLAAARTPDLSCFAHHGCFALRVNYLQYGPAFGHLN